ncbi:MAG: hypothetical protein ABI592_10100 [Acidobacteriota bacterium]
MTLAGVALPALLPSILPSQLPALLILLALALAVALFVIDDDDLPGPRLCRAVSR